MELDYDEPETYATSDNIVAIVAPHQDDQPQSQPQQQQPNPPAPALPRVAVLRNEQESPRAIEPPPPPQQQQNQEIEEEQEQEEEEETWEVKQVLDRRTNPSTGEYEYLIEWKKWDGSPTWEPEENCDCSLLIRKFEKQLEKKNVIKKRQLKLERIIGALKGPTTHLVVKWIGVDGHERVSIEVIRKHFPQQLIDFMLAKIRWN